MKKICIIIGFLMLCVVQAFPQNPEYVSSTLWTGIYDVKISSGYAYCAFSNGLVILDVTDTASISFVGQALCLSSCSAVDVSGEYAFVAGGYSGMQIINISDPSNPRWLNYYDTNGWVADVCVSGNFAYVADISAGILILDISAPYNPILVGTYAVGTKAVKIRGDFVYAAIGSTFRIIDVSLPSNPTQIGNIGMPAATEDVCLTGQTACLVLNDGRLQIVDISNPAIPEILGSIDTPSYSFHVTMASNLVYLTDRDNGLYIVDITNAAEPLLLGNIDTPGRADGIYVENGFAYLADATSLHQIDCRNPVDPTFFQSYTAPVSLRDVDIMGEYAYVVDYGFELYALNISRPTIPLLASSCLLPSLAYSAFTTDGHVFVADGNGGLQIINAEDPESLFIEGIYDTPGCAYDVSVQGSFSFIADSSSIQVIDISDASNPTFISSYSLHGIIKNVFVQDTTLYVLDYRNGRLLLVDVSDPHLPREMGSFDAAGNFYDIDINGQYAYIATSNQNLGKVLIVDVSDVDNLVQVGNYDLPFPPRGVVWYGNTLAVADYIEGLYLLDVSEPTNPSLVCRYDTPGEAFDVTYSNGYVYVADIFSFMILSYPLSHIKDVGSESIPSHQNLLYNYPNPFNSKTIISIKGIDCAEVGVFDITGKLITRLYTFGGKAVWDGQGYPSGAYFAKVLNIPGIKAKKLLLLK